MEMGISQVPQAFQGMENLNTLNRIPSAVFSTAGYSASPARCPFMSSVNR